MKASLEVWLHGQPVGTLFVSHGQLGFQYLASWLATPGAAALSQSLPLQVEAFPNEKCRAYFSGLLPEGRLRQLVAQQFQVSRKNDFGLLDAIGGECAGAVTVVSPGLPRVHPAQAAVDWLEDEQWTELLQELPQRPLLAGRDGLRLSLAGAQDKLPVVVAGSRVGLPRGDQPSTHIVKPPIAALPDSVANECFCLALANAAGLPTAQATTLSLGGRLVLLVTRYDRETQPSGTPQRLHQEDICQALGIAPELKYQNEGGPSLADCFGLLRNVTRPSAPEVLRLLDAVAFNALIGNHDAHGKNFSLLYRAGAPHLAPLYDLLSTAVYERLTPKMAMKIGGRYKFTEVQARHWQAFAEEAGLSWAQTSRRILALAERLPVLARQLQATPPFSSEPVIARIVDTVERRAALTANRLREG